MEQQEYQLRKKIMVDAGYPDRIFTGDLSPYLQTTNAVPAEQKQEVGNQQEQKPSLLSRGWAAVNTPLLPERPLSEDIYPVPPTATGGMPYYPNWITEGVGETVRQQLTPLNLGLVGTGALLPKIAPPVVSSIFNRGVGAGFAGLGAKELYEGVKEGDPLRAIGGGSMGVLGGLGAVLPRTKPVTTPKPTTPGLVPEIPRELGYENLDLGAAQVLQAGVPKMDLLREQGKTIKPQQAGIEAEVLEGVEGNTSVPKSTSLDPATPNVVQSTPFTGQVEQATVTGYDPTKIGKGAALPNRPSVISPELGGQIVKQPIGSRVPESVRPDTLGLGGEAFRNLEEQAATTGVDPLTMSQALKADQNLALPKLYKKAQEILNPPKTSDVNVNLPPGYKTSDTIQPTPVIPNVAEKLKMSGLRPEIVDPLATIEKFGPNWGQAEKLNEIRTIDPAQIEGKGIVRQEPVRPKLLGYPQEVSKPIEIPQVAKPTTPPLTRSQQQKLKGMKIPPSKPGQQGSIINPLPEIQRWLDEKQKKSPTFSDVMDAVLLRPPVEKLRRAGGVFKDVADTHMELRQQERRYSKPFINEVLETASKHGYKNLDKAYEILVQERHSRTPVTITDPDVKANYDALKKAISLSGDIKVAEKIPVWDAKLGHYRLPVKDDFYVFEMYKPEVYEAFTGQHPTQVVAKEQYKKDFMDWGISQGVDPKIVADELKTFENSLATEGITSAKFAGNRLAESIGSPPSWRDMHGARVTTRYFRRFGKDVAWFKEVQSDPKLARALGETQDPWGKILTNPQESLLGNPEVKALQDEFLKHRDFTDPDMGVLNKVTSNAIMGISTQTANTLQLPLAMIPLGNNPVQMYKIAKGMVDIKNAWRNVRKTGGYSEETSNYHVLFEDGKKTLSKIEALATGFGKWVGGRKVGEILEKTLLQGGGEIVIPYLRAEAAKGTPFAVGMMKELNPKGKNLSNAELATRLMRLQSGTYDLTTLPTWQQRQGVPSGPFKLLRWSTGRAYYVRKMLVEPALKGDMMPLLRYLTAGIPGGYGIYQLLRSKTSMPDVRETLAITPAQKKLLAYNIFQAGAAISIGGLYTDLLKSAMDIGVTGRNNLLTTPAFELARNIITETSQATTAMMTAYDEGRVTEIGKIALLLAGRLVHNNVQTIRVLQDIIDKTTGAKQEQSDIRDYKAFQIASGKTRPSSQRFSGNPYLDLERKQWKSEKDPAKAAKTMPKVLANELRGVRTKKDLDEMKQRINTNPIRTMPNPFEDPQSWAEYEVYNKKLGRNHTNYVQRYQELLKDREMKKIR